MPTLRLGKKNYSSLVGCFFVVAWLCLAQLMGNSVLIMGCLVYFLWVITRNTANNNIIPVLMFFLPWSRMLKPNPGMMSFFTVALFGVCLLNMLRRNVPVNGKSLLAAIFLLLLTLLTKMIDSSSVDNSYIMFFFLLVFFPALLQREKRTMDFRRCVVFFAWGILSAAVSAQLLGGNPNISRYMGEHYFGAAARFSAYYGDPNFYAAHISAAVGGLLLILSKEERKKARLGLWFVVLLLLYYGLLSTSKTFVLVIVCLWSVWVAQGLLTRRVALRKVAGILTVFIAFFLIMRLPVFQDILGTVILRIQRSSNDMSSLTTGRTDIWRDYVHALFNDGKLFLIGLGFTKGFISTGYASHNTLLQGMFQFGLLGILLLWGWFMACYRDRSVKVQRSSKAYALILLLGAFLPWMSLDMLYFDEFFLMPLFVAAGFRYLSTDKTVVEAKELINCE